MRDSVESNKILLALWALFVVLIPFFVLGKTPVQSKFNPRQLAVEKVEGGMPQPADFLMVALAGMVFASLGVRVVASAMPVVRAFAWFTLYVILVDAVWCFLVEDLDLLKNPLFYAYDFLLLLTFLVLYSGFQEKLLRVTVHAVAVSLFLQVLLSPLAFDAAQFRQRLFFNTPIQLGYFSVLFGSLFYVGTNRFHIHRAYQGCVYAAVTYLTILSLGKASLIGLAILLILVSLQRPVLLLAGGLFLGAGLLVTAALTGTGGPGLLEKVEWRLSERKADETPEARGYDRIVHHPEYLIFGAGEGANYRFRSGHPGELHSTVGTVLFCYGLVGTALFTYAVVVLFKPDPRLLIGLLPSSVYGLVEHGLRFTSFWVLLAFICCLARRTEQQPPREGGAPDASSPAFDVIQDSPSASNCPVA
jgi:hypothetical protein